MNKKFTIVLVLILTTLTAKADLGWHLAYEHDIAGNTVNGSLTNLVDAIQSGADVKLLTLWPDSSVGTAINPNGLWLNDDLTKVTTVFRTVAKQVNSSGNQEHISDSYELDYVINTGGHVSIIRYHRNGNKINQTSLNWPIRWYVNY